MSLFLKLLDIRIGRCNRRQYWLVLLAFSIANSFTDYLHYLGWPVLVFLLFAIPYFFMLIFARRARDLNYSAWIPGIALLVLLILALIEVSISHTAMPMGVILKTISLIIDGLIAVTGLTWIMMAILMAFVPGTKGQNRYGLAPIGFNFKTMVESGADLTGNPPDMQAPWRTKAETGWQKSNQEPESN